MLLTLTVSPEALEDVGCLHALGPRGLTACHRIVARRSMGLNAQPPTIHSWLTCSCSTWTLQGPHKKVQTSPPVGNQCSCT